MLHEYIELKKGWVIRKPYWMSNMDMYRYRFDPITIGLIVAGGALTAKSQIEQGRAARRAGREQAAIAERNALLAERQAEAEQQAAAEKARQQRRKGEALKGAQRAAIAKSGVQARGTPLSIIVETAENLEADRLTILREGQISTAQRRGQAGVLRAQGASAKARGKAAARAANLAAAGTILTTVGTAALAATPTGAGTKTLSKSKLRSPASAKPGRLSFSSLRNFP